MIPIFFALLFSQEYSLLYILKYQISSLQKKKKKPLLIPAFRECFAFLQLAGFSFQSLSLFLVSFSPFLFFILSLLHSLSWQNQKPDNDVAAAVLIVSGEIKAWPELILVFLTRSCRYFNQDLIF